MKKLVARMMAALICVVMITAYAAPAAVSAAGDGVFDESWLKSDTLPIYNEHAVIGEIDIQYSETIDGIHPYKDNHGFGWDDYNHMMKTLKNHFNSVYSLGNRTGVNENVRGDSSYPGSQELYNLAVVIHNYDWMLTKIENDVNAVNTSSSDARPAKLKKLYDDLKSINDNYSNYLNGYTDLSNSASSQIEYITNNLDSLLSYYDSIYNGWTTWSETKTSMRSLKKSAAMWFRGEELIFTSDTSIEVARIEKSFEGDTGTLLDTNKEAVKWYIFDRGKYLSSVWTKAQELYNSAPVGYFDNVISEKRPGNVEQNLAELVRDVTGGLRSILDGNTIRFENIIYGRVKTGANAGLVVNNFSFELEKNNMYGIAGSMIFVLLRGIFVVGILVFFIYYLTKESMAVSARARSKLKENIGFVLLSIFLLYAMPNLVDLFIHLRDLVLYSIAHGLVDDSVFDSMSSLADNFRNAAESSNGLIDACEYLGIVVITVYLAFVYIGMAAAMTIMFAFFPMFVVFSFRDHKILNEWVTFVLGVISTPLIDAVLFVIPLIATKINVASDLVKLILCMSIIPARGMIRRLLGFSSSAGAELVGLGALMAGGRAIGAVARTARNTVGNVVGGASSVASDIRNSRLQSKLADDQTDTSAVESEAADGTSPLNRTVNNINGASAAAGGGTSSPSSRKIYNDSVGINNFEDNLSNIDHATAAKMYRQRAARTALQTMFRTAGSVQGGIAGATVGLGASTFLGTNAAMMLGSGGMAVGSEIGDVAGYGAGTAAAFGGRLAASAYSHYHTGIDSGTPDGSPDSGFQLFAEDDVRSGIIQANAASTMRSVLENDAAYAERIRNNFNDIVGAKPASKEDVSKMEKDVVGAFGKYSEIAAACQSDNRYESLDSAYSPVRSKSETFNTINDVIQKSANARIDSDYNIWFEGQENAPADFKELPYAFPNIHDGYSMESYYDRKTGMSYTPSQGYIGRKMLSNMSGNPSSAGGHEGTRQGPRIRPQNYDPSAKPGGPRFTPKPKPETSPEDKPKPSQEDLDEFRKYAENNGGAGV